MSVDKNYCKFSHCLNIAEIVSQAEDRGAGGGGGGLMFALAVVLKDPYDPFGIWTVSG